MLKQNDIKVVPLKIRFGSKEYKETEFSVDEFYRMLKESTELPKTSQPSPQDLFLFISRSLMKAMKFCPSIFLRKFQAQSILQGLQ